MVEEIRELEIVIVGKELVAVQYFGSDMQFVRLRTSPLGLKHVYNLFKFKHV